MKGIRTILLGATSLGLMAHAAFAETAAPAATPAWAAEAILNEAYDGTVMAKSEGEYGSMPAADLGAGLTRNDPGTASPGVSGVTSFYGSAAPATTPAWAAEAQMSAADTAAAAEAAPTAAAAEVPVTAKVEAPHAAAAIVHEGVQGVTSCYGLTAPKSPPTWAAEAQFNPDYKAGSAPAAATVAASETAAPAAATAGAVHEGLPGVTSYYGITAPSSAAAWSAPATMNPDYAASGGDASPAVQQAVESCRDALNTEVKKGIRFASNKWDVLPESFKTLNRLAKIAKDCDSGFVIEVGGHTDNVGSEEINQKISELRANAVRAFLTKAGVEAGKLKTAGYGQSKPVADNATPEGRAKNRRIEFLVIAN